MSKPLMKALLNLIHQKEGKYTREFALEYSALIDGYLPQRLLPDATAKIICGFCSTGCSLTVHLKDGKPVNLTPTPDYPVNLGAACPKGWEALAPLTANDRGTTPLFRSDRAKNFVAASWPEALETFTNRFHRIQQEYGPESVAFLSTGQITSEEMAMLGALTKFGMGIKYGDGNTRQCMATAVTAYKESFGFDAPPYTYQDFEESDVLVFVGANPCIAHPIMWERVAMNRHQPEIIVIDPRKTETAMAATQHYALQPKSDLLLLYGVARLLWENGWCDDAFIERHTSSFADFIQHLKGVSLDEVTVRTGLSRQRLEQLARTIHDGKRVSFWWTMGVNQSHEGVRVAQAIINIALMTGNIGRPGTGANSITGQCNAMGSRLFSNTTNLLGGHDFTNAEHRRKIARILEVAENRIPDENSWAYDEIIEGIGRGAIKGLWVIGTNPAHSWINQHQLHELFAQLDFLIVQDMYPTTETAQLADLYFPSAGWGEKEGTFINSERRVGLVKKVAHAPGQALADFYIFKLIAEYWGCGRMFRNWNEPEDVFQSLKQVSAGQPCDISGIRDYRMIDRCGGIQWPFPSGDANPQPERRLFEDGRFYHADGRARFIFEAPRPNPEEVSPEYPFALMTGRGTSAQWHTQTRTAKSAVLRKMYPSSPYVEINPYDALSLGILQGEWIRVRTRRGDVRVQAVVTQQVGPGQLFMPMHYVETNRLTFPAFDPYSHQPAYKLCAAQVDPANASVGRQR